MDKQDVEFKRLDEIRYCAQYFREKVKLYTLHNNLALEQIAAALRLIANELDN